MPQFLGNKVVVTKDELVPRFYNTYEALAQALYRYKSKNYGIKRAVRGCYGHKLLIEFDSLSSKIQEVLGDPRIKENPLELFYQRDDEASDFYNRFQYPDHRYLTDQTKSKLIINASVLVALVKLEEARTAERVRMQGSTRGILDTLYTDAHAFNAVLAKRTEGQVQHTLNSSSRRFKQQFKEFKENGFKSLIRDADGVAKKNALKIDKQTEKLLESLYAGLETKPTPTEAARTYQAFLNGYVEVANQYTGAMYEPKDFKTLSASAITTFLRSYESKIGTFSKRSANRQKLLQAFVPYEKMEKPSFAGSIISIDDRQPPFEYEKGKRMWWYIGIDVASQAIVAWAYGKTKQELIKDFYKNMVANHHQFGVPMPNELECESSLNSSFKNTFLQNGSMFQKVNIHANSARSKIIERFFGKLRYEFEKEHIGWIGRPFARNEANQTDSTKKQIVPYDKLVKQCFGDIIKWNNSAKKGTNISRFDYFLQNQHPDLKPTNYREFIKHLGTKTETSCKAGLMLMQRQEWLLGQDGEVSSGENLIKILKQVEGKQLDVYRLENDKGEVYKAFVYLRADQRFVCEAVAKPVSARASIEETEAHREARTILSKYRLTVEKFMQMRKNQIEPVFIIDNRKNTVSNSFSIDGFEKFEQRKTKAEEVPTHEEDYQYQPTTYQPTGLRDAFLS